MPLYVFQARVGEEARLLGIASRSDPELRSRLLWPRRRLRVRKGGRWSVSEAPIFPGYVFLRSDVSDEPRFDNVRRLPGFLRFLKSNTDIVPLGLRDMELLSHLLSFGEVVGPSVAYFDEQKRIRVTSGPLRGLEGRIVRVDRRKGRARVKLDLYDDSFVIDFGFQCLEAAPASQPGSAPAGAGRDRGSGPDSRLAALDRDRGSGPDSRLAALDRDRGSAT